MGITGFAKFISETWPEAVTETSIKDYNIEGRIAVDGNNESYVYMHTSKVIVIGELDNEEVVTCVRDSEARKKLYEKIKMVWIHKVVEFLIGDLKGNVVWVVDGPNTPVLKSEVREERKQKIEVSREKFYEFSKHLDDDFIDPISARTNLREYLCSIPPKKSDYELLLYVLFRVGIPVIRAWGEGEKTCARLCMEDTPEHLRCRYVWSADVDSVLFGAPLLIQRMKRGKNPSPDVKEPSIRIIDSSKILVKKKDLVDMCVATGCDYYKKGVPRMGLKTAYKILMKGETIPQIPETENLSGLFEHLSEEKYDLLRPSPPQESEVIKDHARNLIGIYHI